MSVQDPVDIQIILEVMRMSSDQNVLNKLDQHGTRTTLSGIQGKKYV